MYYLVNRSFFKNWQTKLLWQNKHYFSFTLLHCYSKNIRNQWKRTYLNNLAPVSILQNNTEIIASTHQNTLSQSLIESQSSHFFYSSCRLMALLFYCYKSIICLIWFFPPNSLFLHIRANSHILETSSGLHLFMCLHLLLVGTFIVEL